MLLFVKQVYCNDQYNVTNKRLLNQSDPQIGGVIAVINTTIAFIYQSNFISPHQQHLNSALTSDIIYTT